MPQSVNTDSVREAIKTTPVIDHHAHNLLLSEEQDKHPLLSMTTEASGPALHHTSSTLAHMRAVRQLSEVLVCNPQWHLVQHSIEVQQRRPIDAWARRCFEGIETVLIDDGLDLEIVHPYEWHDRLTRSPCKRIVRIERVAGVIFKEMYETNQRSIIKGDLGARGFLTKSMEKFVQAISEAISDTNVVGFKSVICYRTGLGIPPYPELEDVDVEKAVKAILEHENVIKKLSRVEDEVLSPLLVHITTRLIEGSASPKPIQFHTGLGDNDIRLRFSSPSHLQPFIEAYPSVPIVLLHASYPFTKEAGYLASTYANVFLDIGEVFPMVSQEGQENVLREALELCPSEKLTWSTDGHWFPETYLLAVTQVREALEHVLVEYVRRNILRPEQAIKIVQDLLFNTSNRLYKLNLTLKPLELPTEPNVPPEKAAALRLRALRLEDLQKFNDFVAHHKADFFLLQWMDYTSFLRVRLLPKKQAIKRFNEGNLLGITKAVFGLLQQDQMCPGFSAVGEYSLYPCFDSLREGATFGHAVIQCEFREKNGDEVAICPRTVLRKAVEKCASHGMSFLIGFEIEVVFMSHQIADGHYHYGEKPVSSGHSWSSVRALHHGQIEGFIKSIVRNLAIAGIEIEQFHPESSPGQWEFILPPLPPLQAVDTLLLAREIIFSAPNLYNMRATLCPKPVPGQAGSGAHVHMSMMPAGQYESFYAGVLKHLRAILAFTYPNAQSYERSGDSVWAGGSWVAYGSQNREAPLRKIEDSHWEMKCMDGFANPYLALGAIIGAGFQGVLDNELLNIKDCTKDPALLTEKERGELGITKRLPRSIGEALGWLQEDAQMREILGGAVVDTYLAVKTEEGKMLAEMDEGRRRDWLIERY